MSSKTVVVSTLGLALLAAIFVAGIQLGPDLQNKDQGQTKLQGTKSSPTARRSADGLSSLNSSTTKSAARDRLNAAPMITKGSSPEQMILDITRSKNALERNRALLALLDSLSPEEFPSMIDSFRKERMTQQRRGEYQTILTAWAKVRPLDALSYARETTAGDFAVNTILSTWSAADSGAAIAWAAENHENKESPNPWLRGIIEGIAVQDTATASRLMESMVASTEREVAMRSIATQLAIDDPEKAKNWSMTIQDESIRSAACAFTALSLANKNPANAAEWLENLGDIEVLNEASRNIARTWYQNSPDEAKAWIAQLPSDAIAASVEGIVVDRVKDEPLETAEWISQLAISNPETNFENSVRKIVQGAKESDPELAAEWLKSLPSNYSQTLSYHGVLSEWRKQDSEAVREWVIQNEAALPDTIKRAYLEPF